MSAAGHALWKALDNVEDWEILGYTVRHKPSGLEFWMANGPFFFNSWGYPAAPKCIGLLERHWLFWKARTLQVRMAAKCLGQGNS